MTKDTFVRIVKEAVAARGVKLYGSKEAKIAAIGRKVERREVSLDEATEELRAALSDEYALSREDFSTIAKQLKRY